MRKFSAAQFSISVASSAGLGIKHNRLLALVLLLVLFVAPAFVTPAEAHEGRPVFIELNAQQSTQDQYFDYQLRWKIPPVLPTAQLPVISLIADFCDLSKRSGIDEDSVRNAVSQVGLIGAKRYRCSNQAKDLSVSIEYPVANPALSSLIVVTEPSGASRHIFSAPEKTIVSISQDPSAIDVAFQYMAGGIKHILMGWDHLLFVLCLLLIAGSLPRILVAITGFTIAHTVTLILSSLNLISVPNLLIETLIALSIVVLAAEITRVRRYLPAGSVISLTNLQDPALSLSLSWRFPVLVATGFGFVHGFGFASVLSDLGLPSSMKLTALLFFNIGVELGQFLFIAVVTCIALTVAKFIAQETQIRVVNAGVYLVGIIASYWLIQRLAFGV